MNKYFVISQLLIHFCKTEWRLFLHKHILPIMSVNTWWIFHFDMKILTPLESFDFDWHHLNSDWLQLIHINVRLVVQSHSKCQHVRNFEGNQWQTRFSDWTGASSGRGWWGEGEFARETVSYDEMHHCHNPSPSPKSKVRFQGLELGVTLFCNATHPPIHQTLIQIKNWKFSF